jgi:hypothetical protein
VLTIPLFTTLDIIMRLSQNPPASKPSTGMTRNLKEDPKMATSPTAGKVKLSKEDIESIKKKLDEMETQEVEKGQTVSLNVPRAGAAGPAPWSVNYTT